MVKTSFLPVVGRCFLVAAGFAALVSCGHGAAPAGLSVLEFDSVVVDTIVALTAEPGAPRAEIHLDLAYATGKNAETINDSLLHAGMLYDEFLPTVKGRMGVREAVDSFLVNYIEAYRSDFGALYRRDAQRVANYNVQYVCHTSVNPSVEGVATYVADVYAYSGGSHGHHLTVVKNIALDTGRMLTLGDVLVPGAPEELTVAVVDKLCKRYDVDGLKGLQERGIFAMVEPYLPDAFVIQPDGSITFVYSDSEIAPHVEGEIRVQFSADELKPLKRTDN